MDSIYDIILIFKNFNKCSFNTFSINGSDYNSGSAQAIDCGGGIYRLVLTATYTGGSTTTRFYVTPSGADSDYVIIAGMQTEVRPFPTSLIITSGSPVTRNYDDAQIIGTNYTTIPTLNLNILLNSAKFSKF